MRVTRISIATLSALTILLLSSISIPVVSATSSTTASKTFPSRPVTFTGTADSFLLGPYSVSPPYASVPDPTPPANPSIPNFNKPLADPPAFANIPPTVACPGPGCDTVASSAGGATTNPYALSAVDSAPFTVEPPDQALCVGGGYAMESLNQGEVQVYNSATLAPVSGVISLDILMGLTSFPNGGWSSGGDVACQYDGANGGHWFITQIVSASNESVGGPFGGCFAAVLNTCYEGIAVSATGDPLGSYNVYFLNANAVDSNPETGYLLNDFAKTATTHDAFLMSYDEFGLVSGGFYGAFQFAFSKADLELGHTSVNVAYEDMATARNLSPIPANGRFQPHNLPGAYWFQVIPVQTTDPSQYDNSNGGTGFMVVGLDLFGYGDNRVGVFDWTGLSNLDSPSCASCGGIMFGGQLLTGGVTYQNEGFACPVTDYYTLSTFCGLAAQKAGPIPLGDNCVAFGLNSSDGVTSCPEAGIATNGDGITQAFFSQGQIWTSVSTLVLQAYQAGSPEIHVGAAYWGISASDKSSGVTFSFANQGYVTAMHEDIEFPAVAASGGTVLMSFTLSGDGGPTGADNGGFYPSSAFVMGPAGSNGLGGTIHIADLGQSPQDGFTEYIGTTSSGYNYNQFRPRWGDYGQAVYDPSSGNFFFSSEYIQHPNCNSAAFLSDPTCGGTRVPYANWGSSVNFVGTS